MIAVNGVTWHWFVNVVNTENDNNLINGINEVK
jgi:hypothetical protein